MVLCLFGAASCEFFCGWFPFVLFVLFTHFTCPFCIFSPIFFLSLSLFSKSLSVFLFFFFCCSHTLFLYFTHTLTLTHVFAPILSYIHLLRLTIGLQAFSALWFCPWSLSNTEMCFSWPNNRWVQCEDSSLEQWNIGKGRGYIGTSAASHVVCTL